MSVQQWHNEQAFMKSLDGEWQFSLGEQSGTIQIPGTWEAQGYPRYIDGPAVYEKQVMIPIEWDGSVIQLQFDAVSYHVEIEVNGTAVGTHTGLWTPFALDVTEAIKFGENNTIRLTMYKPGERFPMRESLAGFLPDVCIPFGGIWQNAQIVAFPGAAINEVFLNADTESGILTVNASLHNADGLWFTVAVFEADGTFVVGWRDAAADNVKARLLVDMAETLARWSPEHPALYRAEIALEDSNGNIVAQIERKFGFRTLSRDGEALLLNDAPITLRGVLNWGWYPEILCPAPDEATIRAEFNRVRAAGYNMVKLCLSVPSQLYFDIADEEGMLLWLELPMWLPKVTDRLREQAPIEYADILAAVHHHPSIVIYSLGCELNSSVDGDLLGKLNTILRERTAGVLVCDNSGSGEAYGGLVFDYADFNDYHFYADLQYFNPLVDHFQRDWRPARPWIFGEFCDADDFRDIDEIATAKGKMPWWLVEQNPLHPFSFIAYSQQPLRMPKVDIPFDAQALQRISRQQSFVIRKTILEKVRARASMGGYVVTGIRDTPLATSSMFDDLGRAKYDADAFREFNGDSVLVLEQGRRRTWKNGGDRPAPVDKHNLVAGSQVVFRLVLSNTGRVLPAGEIRWRLIDASHTVVLNGIGACTERPASHVPAEIAAIVFTAPDVTSAQAYTLEVEIGGSIRNHWRLWVYPEVKAWSNDLAIYDPAGVLVTLDDLYQNVTIVPGSPQGDIPLHICGAFTSSVYHYVNTGGRVILLQPGAGSLPVKPAPFWREAIKLLYDHPLLANFPHDGHADLQFYHLATDYAIDIDQLQAQFTNLQPVREVRSIIQRLDARAFTLLDYLVEFKIGAGTLLASTLRFGGGAGDQVQGLQRNIAGRHLLNQMIEYLLAAK